MLSVVIPAYNCGNYIRETLQSVVDQTYKNIEIIVVDDGSLDNTRKEVEKFGMAVRYFWQQNQGPSAARNLGIKEAAGDIIAFLDADDLWLPDKLARSVAFMKERGFDWLCTAMTKYQKDGSTILKKIDGSSGVLDMATKEIKQLKKGLFFFSDVPVHTPTIVAKRICFDRVGVFDESFRVGEDTDLWLRFEEAGLRGGYLDEPLTIYRYNEKSITKGNKIDGLRDHVRVARKHAKILGMDHEIIRNSYADFLWQIASRYFVQKRFIRTFYYTCLSFFYCPRLSRLKKVFSYFRKRI